MANTDKDILITPNVGSTDDPKIEFKGADASTSAQTITANVYPSNNGTVSFEGSGGQLFSINNSTSGTIFSVNDLSGVPSIEVKDTGLVRLAEYAGDVVIGQSGPSYTTTDNASVISTISNNKLHVNGSIQLTNNNDAIVFGRGSGSFMRDEEIGFGWGGGWYMTDGTYLRVRGNKHIYSTGDITVNNAYVGDKVIHSGDTDTHLQFGTDAMYMVTAGGNNMTFASSWIDSNVPIFNYSVYYEDFDALTGTSVTITTTNAQAFALIMSGNTTFTFTNPANAWSYSFVLQLVGNASTAYTVTWPSSVVWSGGTAPDAPGTGELDMYVFYTRDGGATWYGAQSHDAAA